MSNYKEVQGLNYGMVNWEGGSFSAIKTKEQNGNIFERVVSLLFLACELGVVDESLILCDSLLCYNSQGDEYIIFPCTVCGERTEVVEVVDFDPDYHYCGGSPSCCP